MELPQPIFWTHHRNIELIGASLAHIKKGLLCAEAGYGKSRVGDDPAYSYRRSTSHRPFDLWGDWTSLISRWMPTDSIHPYSHWLLDALPRLALLDEFPPGVKILVPPHQLPYQVSSLQMLGLWDRCRLTSETRLRVGNYYFSSPTAMIMVYNPYAVRWLRKTFLPLVNASSPTPKRFFLRRFGPARNITNESKVLDFFRERGWEIIDPGALSFPDQIRLFANAEAICGIHGSAFANVIWCPPGCRILEIFCWGYWCGGVEWISQCLSSVEYRYLVFPSDNRFNAIVDLKKLKEAVQSMGWG
jgi:capsular polysaccharide biosynthesis protein